MLVNVNFVVFILGWFLSNCKGIFIVKFVGIICFFNVLWFMFWGVFVNNMEIEFLVLCIWCFKLVNEVFVWW